MDKLGLYTNTTLEILQKAWKVTLLNTFTAIMSFQNDA